MTTLSLTETVHAFRFLIEAALGAPWLTPAVAKRLQSIESKAIERRCKIGYGYPENQMVCHDVHGIDPPIRGSGLLVTKDALAVVQQASGLDARVEGGLVNYPGISTAHVWIRVIDGTIIDTAAAQFGQKSPLAIPLGHPLQHRYMTYGPWRRKFKKS